MNNYNFNDLRNSIGGYLRDETLFEGTLLENITLGRDKASFENVQWAIDAIGLTDFVARLSHGYDTTILPAGKQFSKSTLAKILIARAIVNKPRLLLLENSFSVFSPEDRNHILKFLLSRQHNWTVLLTSSQPVEFPELIDRQIVLHDGKIINANS